MKKISIIGGSGFIGTRLVKRITTTKEYSVCIVDKVLSRTFPDLTTFADVRSLDSLYQAVEFESIIVNLAAEHRDDVTPRSLYDEVNVEGAKNICKIANDKNINTIVFTSSVAVFGFAPIGTDESGEISPFNDYGRTKYEAELIYKAWQSDSPNTRTLVIIRPTVVFGEQNRGNVYNLLRQISSGNFVMVGSGNNRKSLAYVENVASFIEYSLKMPTGVHTYNYIDKPDLTMNCLVESVSRLLGKSYNSRIRIPYLVGYAIGKCFDLVSAFSGISFSISSIRIKKFCTNSVYNTSISNTDFAPPVPLSVALEKTIRHEFIEADETRPLFYSE
jgi:nucleoside-diphosphate-sugar epimerase